MRNILSLISVKLNSAARLFNKFVKFALHLKIDKGRVRNKLSNYYMDNSVYYDIVCCSKKHYGKIGVEIDNVLDGFIYSGIYKGNTSFFIMCEVNCLENSKNVFQEVQIRINELLSKKKNQEIQGFDKYKIIFKSNYVFGIMHEYEDKFNEVVKYISSL